MKLAIEIRPDGIFSYSYEVGNVQKASGTQDVGSHSLGLFVDVLRELEKIFIREDKWSTQLEAIRRLVEKEKDEAKNK